MGDKFGLFVITCVQQHWSFHQKTSSEESHASIAEGTYYYFISRNDKYAVSEGMTYDVEAVHELFVVISTSFNNGVGLSSKKSRTPSI